MGLLRKLFADGTGRKKDLTAREGYALALEALQEAHPIEADRTYLCCVYTSAADANAGLERDGTCRGWHFDFFLPASRTLYLVRVNKGTTRGTEMAWEKTQKSPVEYVYAVYGASEQVGVEPPRLPDDWLDSPAVTAAMQESAELHGERSEGLEPAALCLPAEHLRYLQEDTARNVLSLPAAPRDSFAAICSPEDPYAEDSLLLYIQATTGTVLEKRAFRFPNLFYFGTSRNW